MRMTIDIHYSMNVEPTNEQIILLKRGIRQFIEDSIPDISVQKIDVHLIT